MTDDEAFHVKLMLEQNCPTAARAKVSCTVLGTVCATHRFLVVNLVGGQWGVMISRIAEQQQT